MKPRIAVPFNFSDGSVAQYVLRQAECSVVTVRAHRAK